MSPEIPTLSKLEFKELLSHTFPGFFLALSVFMVLDVLSPKDLTLWAFGTLTKFVSAIAFIILLGTILGILIDGIQHSFERIFFEEGLRYKKEVKTKAKVIYPFDDVRHYYYFKRVGEEAFNHLTNNYYRYAEFYGNIFISLIAFSCIAPFYFRDILKIDHFLSFFFGCVVPFALACLCIWSSYTAFVKYHSHKIDMIIGYLGLTKFIEVAPSSPSVKVNESVEITAQLKELNLRGLEEKDLEKIKELKGVNLKILLEKLKKYKVWKASDLRPLGKVKIRFDATVEGMDRNQVETDDGEATARFTPKKSGTATITASSEGFISGKVDVKVDC